MSKATQALTQIPSRVNLLSEFGRTVIAILVTYVVYGLLPPETDFDLSSAVYWDVWAATYLGLTWFLILRSSPE